jgi:chromate transporter
VGFFAGWKNPGVLSPLAAGTLGAALTTYVTFLPSFLFILLGAPYIESLHEHRSIGSALGAITAAVVGVMLNLAVFLGWQVFYAASGRIDIFAIVVALGAFVALHRFNMAIHWLVLAGAALGLAWAAIA